jgi:hypothetical protein
VEYLSVFRPKQNNLQDDVLIKKQLGIIDKRLLISLTPHPSHFIRLHNLLGTPPLAIQKSN